MEAQHRRIRHSLSDLELCRPTGVVVAGQRQQREWLEKNFTNLGWVLTCCIHIQCMNIYIYIYI